MGELSHQRGGGKTSEADRTCRPGNEGKAAPGTAHLMQKRALIAKQYSALHHRTWITPTVQKPCSHGLQNKKAMKSFDFTAFSGAMEGTRTPGLPIRSQSLYPAELPTHTFRSEHDVFYHAESGLSTGFLNFFDSFLNRASFRTFFCIKGPISPPVRGAGRSSRRWAWRQGRPGRSRAGPGRADCPRGPWRQ